MPEPDYGRLAGPVAQRVRSALSELRAAERDPAVTGVDLGRVYGEAGQLLMANELNAAAIACLRNATSSDPADARWPYLLGYLLQSTGRPETAAAAYSEALDRAPGDALVRYRLASVLLDLGRIEEAATRLAADGESAELAAGFAELRARLAATRGELDVAIERYRAALRLAPEATRLHYPLATLLRQRGDLEDANHHAGQAATGEIPLPDPWLAEVASYVAGPQGYLVRGLRAEAAGDLQAAKRALGKAVELAPEDPQTHLNLGAVLLSLDELEEAERHLEAALRLRSDYAEAHHNLARIAEQRGDLPTALDHYRRAAELAPHNAEFRFPYARLLIAAGRQDAAIPQLRAVLRDAPTDLGTRFLLAVALEGSGQRTRAQQVAAEAFELAPDDSHVAELYVRLTSTTAGVPDAERERSLALARRLYEGQDRSPNSAEALAMALAAAGRFGEAAELQRAIVESVPDGVPEVTVSHLRRHLERYEAGLRADRAWTASPVPSAD